MQRISILLLIVLAITVMTPLSSFSIICSGSDGEVLAALDVCHSAAPAVSANGEMPCMHTTADAVLPPVFVSTLEFDRPVFTDLILSTRNEQPPRS